MMALALEVQHGVDDVLEGLGAGEAAVLRHMADEQRRHVLAFGGKQQLRRRLAHLADAAGRRLEFQREHRLDRIDDHQSGPDARDLLENPLEARFSEQKQRRIAHAKPLAARLDLVLRFLAGAVQHRSDRPRHVGGSLQQQRGLADPGLAAQQDQRAGHDAAAEDAIELVDARRKPGVLLDFDLGIQARRCRGASERVAMTRRRPRIARGGRSLLDKRIPRAAVGTAAEPLGGL